MLGFNHTLAGSIVAVIIPAPMVPIVAFTSHFLLDITPHYGKDPKVKPGTKRFRLLLAIDGTLCVLAYVLAVSLFPSQWIIIGIGAFFSLLPDFFWLFLKHRISKGFDLFLQWAGDIQWGERPYGWIFDGLYGIVMCITLYLLAGQPWS